MERALFVLKTLNELERNGDALFAELQELQKIDFETITDEDELEQLQKKLKERIAHWEEIMRQTEELKREYFATK